MKLWELEKEINDHKRIANHMWTEPAVYIIKSMIAESPLIECNCMSMELRNYTPTLEELFSNDWYVMDS